MDKTHFVGFFLRILRIFLHLYFIRILRIFIHFKQFLYTTNQNQRSENLLFSRNLIVAERKRQGQGGVMWTEDHKRSDTNHIAWINLMQNNTSHCAKLGLMTAQRICIDTFTVQVTAPGLFGGFSFRGLKKLMVGGGDSWIHSTAQRKEHSKTEFGKKNSENEFGESETFYQSKFSPATGITEQYGNWISWYLDVSPSWCRHFQYLGFLTGAPTTNFAWKRVKTRYSTLFHATKNSVVICRASLLYKMSYSFRSGMEFYNIFRPK